MAIEWAVYQRPGKPMTAEPYSGTKQIVAISLTEKQARDFALNQNRAAKILRRLNRKRQAEQARDLAVAQEKARHMGFGRE